jgi:anti-sigma28 factor (negative regulator of flagellin synthesis)
MQVNKFQGEIARPDAVQKPQGTPPVGAPGSGESPDARRNDHVQISDAGRALSSDASESSTKSELDPARADEIRSKILSGAYNSLAMANDVARSILRSGDL